MNLCRRRPRTAMALLCGCTLVALFLYQRDRWRECAAQKPSVEEQFLAKYAPLRALLPAGEVARFEVDAARADLRRMHPDGRLFLAQYAAAPRLLRHGGTATWLVVDSDDATHAPPAPAGCKLAADLHNGVRLYRTTAGD